MGLLLHGERIAKCMPDLKVTVAPSVAPSLVAPSLFGAEIAREARPPFAHVTQDR